MNCANPYHTFHHSSAQGNAFHPRSFFHGQVFERCQSLMFPKTELFLDSSAQVCVSPARIACVDTQQPQQHHCPGPPPTGSLKTAPPTSPKKVINFCSATSEVGQMPGFEAHITNIINLGFGSRVKNGKPRSNKNRGTFQEDLGINRSGPFLLQITKNAQPVGGGTKARFFSCPSNDGALETPWKWCWCTPFIPGTSSSDTFYTRHLLHQTTFSLNTFYNRHLLHQTPFTPDTFYSRHIFTRHLLHQTPFTTTHLLHQTPFTPDTFYTRHLLHQTTQFTPNNTVYTRHLWHQTPFHQTHFTPNTFYTRQLSQQTTFTPTNFYTRHTFYTRQLSHQTIFTPTNFYTCLILLHQPVFTPDTFYTNQLLHQTPFTPTSFYTRHLLHQTPFTPNPFYTTHLFTRHPLHQTPSTRGIFLHQTPFTLNPFYTRQLLH